MPGIFISLAISFLLFLYAPVDLYVLRECFGILV